MFVGTSCKEHGGNLEVGASQPMAAHSSESNGNYGGGGGVHRTALLGVGSDSVEGAKLGMGAVWADLRAIANIREGATCYGRTRTAVCA